MGNTIWHRQNPDLIDDIQSDLRQRQPNLHLHIHRDGRSEIRGTFVVWSDIHKELDRYQVEIRLLGRYPKKLPIVKEIGGRIPRIAGRHVNEDGTACVLMPEDRGRCFPEGAPLSAYLDGPLHDFFLSQTWYEREGKWPFDQWSHGPLGILEYYRDLIGVTDGHVVLRYLRVLSYPKIKKHLLCPCGSGKRLRICCYDQVMRLRATTDPVLAKRSLKTLEAARRMARAG